MTLIDVLQERYVPLLQIIAAQLRERHPTFTIGVGSGSYGGSPVKWYHAYIESMCPASNDPEPNCVVLEIGVRDFPGMPWLDSLDVTWGADGIAPCEGLNLLPVEAPFRLDALPIIDQALPQLQAHLEHCLHKWEATYPAPTP